MVTEQWENKIRTELIRGDWYNSEKDTGIFVRTYQINGTVYAKITDVGGDVVKYGKANDVENVIWLLPSRDSSQDPDEHDPDNTGTNWQEAWDDTKYWESYDPLWEAMDALDRNMPDEIKQKME